MNTWGFIEIHHLTLVSIMLTWMTEYIIKPTLLSPSAESFVVLYILTAHASGNDNNNNGNYLSGSNYTKYFTCLISFHLHNNTAHLPCLTQQPAATWAVEHLKYTCFKLGCAIRMNYI